MKLNYSRHAATLRPISLSYKCKSAERAILGHTLVDSSIQSQRPILQQSQKHPSHSQLKKKVTELFQKESAPAFAAPHPMLARSQTADQARTEHGCAGAPRERPLARLTSTPNLRVKSHADSLACRPAGVLDMSASHLFSLEPDEEHDHRFLILLRRFISDEQLYVRALYTMEKCFAHPLQKRYEQKRRKQTQKWRLLLGLQSHNAATGRASHGPLASFADNARSKMEKASRKITLRAKDTATTCAAPTSLDPIDVLERMFFYLPILADIHSDFLAQLKRMLTTQPSIMQLLYVINIMASMTSRFSVYKDIINQAYVKAIADFESLVQTDKGFRRAVEACTEATDHLKLRALLQRTRNRVDYYVEMLETLRAKYILPEATYTLAKADQCIDSLMQIAQQTRKWQVGRAAKLAEDTEKIALAASALQGSSSFLVRSEDRTLISGSVALCKTSNPAMKRPMNARLLADHLLLQDPTHSNDYAESVSALPDRMLPAHV
ncbi:hypothetical protein SYNPS1DRAFT_23167 [Syncephalis pseudoplumigaleata]|uniref:DH domain-containing protein n=1 Tax=Syncephalis pseudoplumigaleata TaxID=1712513 RepID=A0A4P9YXH1_9FUNG|nr:hypothetical protein SYNPS1DRAFT_23167 [Syncephalis pseudoplumigaleata]|eukprot:RKP24776.1 hypothetical protein SYNPS1DRAFT_23167 [Syncephalis pseudoplumigaleata]